MGSAFAARKFKRGFAGGGLGEDWSRVAGRASWLEGEVGLGRSARRGEGTGFGGEAEFGEQHAGERRVGDDGDDAAAPPAGALRHVVDEHAAQEVGPRELAHA